MNSNRSFGISNAMLNKVSWNIESVFKINSTNSPEIGVINYINKNWGGNKKKRRCETCLSLHLKTERVQQRVQ